MTQDPRPPADATPEALAAEAHALHRAAFGGPAPPELVDLYGAAHRTRLRGEPGASREAVRRLVDRGVDLEAVELVLRRRDPQHTLVRKMKLLVYLAEALPAYQDRFVGSRPDRLAVFRLAGQALRTVAKGALGAYLVWRHRP